MCGPFQSVYACAVVVVLDDGELPLHFYDCTHNVNDRTIFRPTIDIST